MYLESPIAKLIEVIKDLGIVDNRIGLEDLISHPELVELISQVDYEPKELLMSSYKILEEIGSGSRTVDLPSLYLRTHNYNLIMILKLIIDVDKGTDQYDYLTNMFDCYDDLLHLKDTNNLVAFDKRYKDFSASVMSDENKRSSHSLWTDEYAYFVIAIISLGSDGNCTGDVGKDIVDLYSKLHDKNPHLQDQKDKARFSYKVGTTDTALLILDPDLELTNLLYRRFLPHMRAVYQ